MQWYADHTGHPQRLDRLTRTARWHHSVSRGKCATNEVDGFLVREGPLCYGAAGVQLYRGNVKGVRSAPRRFHVMLGHRITGTSSRCTESASMQRDIHPFPRILFVFLFPPPPLPCQRSQDPFCSSLPFFYHDLQPCRRSNADSAMDHLPLDSQIHLFLESLLCIDSRLDLYNNGSAVAVPRRSPICVCQVA